MSSRYIPSDSEVPDNKFHLANYAELQRRETPLALRRLLELQQLPILGGFNTVHLQAIHRYIFQDVYDWAGEVRTVNIPKPNALFPLPEHLKSGLDALFAELARENLLRSLTAEPWVRRAAYFLEKSMPFIHSVRQRPVHNESSFGNSSSLRAGRSVRPWARVVISQAIPTVDLERHIQLGPGEPR
jgi:cell filamentation protein